MTQKRKNAGSSSENLLESKRLRPTNFCGSDDEPSTLANPQSRVDPTYGQRSAFPGLDEPFVDDALFYEPARDGFEYLQMVRSEAKGVPNLLVAPLSPRVIATDRYSDREHGYYADGAYTAAPDTTIRSSDEEDEEDPQEAYYTSLCRRFFSLSATLQHPPPIPITSTTSAVEQSSFNPSSPARWRRYIFNTQPRMLLLHQLGQADVVSGLAMLETLLSSTNLQKRKNLGAWAWGLLAKCREVGQMSSEEVSVLRDLGKKAGGIIRGIIAGIKEEEEDGVNAGEREEGEDSYEKAKRVDAGSKIAYSPGGEPLRPIEHPQILDHNGVSNATQSMEIPTSSSKSTDPLAAARQRLLESLQSSSPDAFESETCAAQGPTDNGLEHPKQEHMGDMAQRGVGQQDIGNDETELMIHATLDMIVTIVGEFYGQRDLLDCRILWGELQQ
ncbi:hypothetical protein MMC29_005701 [Sticta canariensis]|nr:hypothetical protein [Sticta canariensis]